MSFFWLWNPTLSASGVEFEITAGNTLDPDELTPADVERCLGVAGLRGSVRGVEVQRARSAFFTSYGDSQDWRDRWNHAWLVRLTGDFERVRPGELPVGLHALDDLDHPAGWEVRHEGPSPALLVVGGLFPSAGALESLALGAFSAALGPAIALKPLASRSIPPRPLPPRAPSARLRSRLADAPELLARMGPARPASARGRAAAFFLTCVALRRARASPRDVDRLEGGPCASSSSRASSSAIRPTTSWPSSARSSRPPGDSPPRTRDPHPMASPGSPSIRAASRRGLSPALHMGTVWRTRYASGPPSGRSLRSSGRGMHTNSHANAASEIRATA